MKILPPQQNIALYKEGFGDTDLLERKKVSKALSSLVDRIDDPVVIALHGKWGTGKTHFLKRWVSAHTLENDSTATTVYFDAFAHDYLNDPLPALVSSLSERLTDEKIKRFEKVKTAAFKLAKPLARIGLATATFGATEVLGAFGDEVVKAASSEVAGASEKYWKEETGRRKAITEFRDALEAFAAPPQEEDSGSSLVFVIDELDRCRPDYALEVLEVIKHFFSVPHVHFILGVNLNALENSVQARYGEKINGHAYLKKFIQITLELPDELGDSYNSKPVNLTYLDYLIKEMGVSNHIANPLRSQIRLVSKFNHISMRDVGKIVSSISLASEDVLNNNNKYRGWILVMIDLIISKIVRPDLYPKFLNATINKADIASYYRVSPSAFTPKIDNKDNSEYNRQMHLKLLTWQYLNQGDQLKTIEHEVIRNISRQFDQYGLESHEARELPKKVHSIWLDQFNFYNPQ